MIVKKQGDVIIEPMSVMIYQIASVVQDVLLANLDKRVRFKIKRYEAGRQIPQSHVAVHTAYAVEANKVYLEYYLSRDMRALIGDRDQEMHDFIRGMLHTNYYDNSMHTWPEIVLTEDQYISADTKQMLSPWTLGYWKGYTNKWQFIEDRAIVEHYMDIARLQNPKWDKLAYFRKIHDINVQYELNKDRHLNIPEAFDAYCEIFQEEFGKDMHHQIDAWNVCFINYIVGKEMDPEYYDSL